jgi:putative aldouronate transport system permease protein
MVADRTAGDRLFGAFLVALMCLLMFVTLYPFLYVLFASFSDPLRLISHSGLLLAPLGFSLASYRMVLSNPSILSGYRNTLFLVTVGTSLNVLMTSLGAYVLSRKGYRLKTLFTVVIVFTMFFSGGLIPFYLTVKALGLTNKLWSLILPSALSTYNMIIMRTAMAAVPDSIEESARLDGANDFTILFRVMLPLVVPTLAVMVLYYGVGHWNAWFNAMIFLRNRELFPLQLILREIILAGDTSSMMLSVSGFDKDFVGETVKYATITLVTLPILFIYPFLQRYFVQGIMIGAIKG